jgi:hypothetical protein
VRIRTIAALLTGAALGAGGTYLLDPEHGPERRRDALRTAWERGREVDWIALAERASGAVAEVGERAADGYRSGAASG